MRINNNISAVITNNQLLGTEDSLAKSMERLSSGLSINHAGDNPSGMAIASKMTAQIEGLEQATTNANDGISVFETADGALKEVTDMIQRMRELSIQAANEINSQAEKNSIQAEIESLKDEIDRISETTEFNTKSLLDGSLNARIYADNCSRIQTTEAVSAGNYILEIVSAATRPEYSMNISGIDYANLPEGSISVNNYEIKITDEIRHGGETVLYDEIRKGAEIGEAETEYKAGTSIDFKSTAYGSSAALIIAFSSDEMAAAFGETTRTPSDNTNVGVDAEVMLQRRTPADASSLFSETATYRTDRNKIIITDSNGFEISFLAEADYAGMINLNVTEIGIMRLQIGANEGQTMNVRIPSTDTKNMYIDDLDVTTINGAGRAVQQCDAALAYTNKVRSQLGAYENRLDHTTKSLSETSENMTQALSRIEDVDMATEMVEYTKLNVLEQAGTSALAQANELPQLALQLLQ